MTSKKRLEKKGYEKKEKKWATCPSKKGLDRDKKRFPPSETVKVSRKRTNCVKIRGERKKYVYDDPLGKKERKGAERGDHNAEGRSASKNVGKMKCPH